MQGIELHRLFEGKEALAGQRLRDPASYPLPKPLNPDSLDPSSDLEKAADWYGGVGATTAFLSSFEVVSDVNMTVSACFVGVGGFQEQIVMTPEPRGVALLLLGLLGVCGILVGRDRSAIANRS